MYTFGVDAKVDKHCCVLEYVISSDKFSKNPYSLNLVVADSFFGKIAKFSSRLNSNL